MKHGIGIALALLALGTPTFGQSVDSTEKTPEKEVKHDHIELGNSKGLQEKGQKNRAGVPAVDLKNNPRLQEGKQSIDIGDDKAGTLRPDPQDSAGAPLDQRVVIQPKVATAPAFVGTPHAGLVELERLARDGRGDEAGLLAKVLIDRVAETTGDEQLQAELCYAGAVSEDMVGRFDQSAEAFKTASVLAGPGQLRLDSLYNQAGVHIDLGERYYERIEEVKAEGMAIDMVKSSNPDKKEMDTLPQARDEYLKAREALISHLRLDWRDEDVRANIEFVQLRLDRLDDIESKRDESTTEQKSKEGKDSEKTEEGEDSDKGNQENEEKNDEEGEVGDNSSNENQKETKDADPQEGEGAQDGDQDPNPTSESDEKPEAEKEEQKEKGREDDQVESEEGGCRVGPRDEPGRGQDDPGPLERTRQDRLQAARCSLQIETSPCGSRLVMKNLSLRALLRCALTAVLSACLFGAPAAAQGDAAFGARLTTGVARLGEELALLITVENASATIESTLRVEGLEIGRIGSPSERSSISITGARRVATRSLTWRISIRPLAVGEYVIPPVDLIVDSQRVSTKAQQLTVVEDLKGEELGFFEFTVSGDTLVEKMPFELEMVFGWDAAMSGKVDYAQLILPWWGNLSELLLELERPPSLMDREQRIGLNGNQQVIVEEIGLTNREGRKFRTFRLKRVFLPTRSTELNLAQPFLEFGRQGQRSIFGAARKKESFFVSGEPLVLSVGALPEDGQPLDYTGAVGMFDVQADVATRDVDVGESIKLNVTWSGQGNFQFFDAPQLDRDEAFEGFRVFGSANREKGLERRTIEFDIAPLDDKLQEIPPVKLSVYDPSKSEFVSIATQPIRIRVRPLENAVSLDDLEDGEGFATDIEDIVAAPLHATSGSSGLAAPNLLTLGLISGGIFIGWLALRIQVRRRRGDPNGPVERRRRCARKQLAKDLAVAKDSADELRALNSFLAARSREPEVAWIGRDAVQHLSDGFGETSEKLATAIAQLERGAYASSKNGSGQAGSGELLQLADQLIRGGL